MTPQEIAEWLSINDLEARVHHAITHNGETYIKLSDASVTFSLYRKNIATQAARIAKLEAALHKIADRTKRAHPQAQEGEIHQIAITALTNNTQENING